MSRSAGILNYHRLAADVVFERVVLLFLWQFKDERTQALKEYLEDIFANKLVFTHSNIHGYSWSKDIVKTLLDKPSNESIKYFTWTGEG